MISILKIPKKIQKACMAAAVVCAGVTLAGCGSDAIEGRYKIQTSVMGVKINSGTAILDEDFININGNKHMVNEWERDGEMITARDSDGNAILHAKVIDGGDALEVTEGNGMVAMRLSLEK